jgi:glycosyltransferase involved in cell wall biosynthesis
MDSEITTPKTTEAAIGRGAPMPLSVILPNFNHGGLIARALRALLDQTPVASEIIVVDDGSTDNSVEVVEALQRQYASIRLIRNGTNRGIIASVKTALEVATGEYLLFAASDDFVLPGLFSHALEGLTAYPRAAFFCASVALLDSHNRVRGVRPVTVPRRGGGYVSPVDVRRVIRKTDFWVLGTSTVYRRRLLADIGYFDASLGSLGDVLANRLLAFRHGFYFDPAVLAAYNKDPMSFSARNALSVNESRRFLAAASGWIGANLPEDVRNEHGRLFDRRMRFGLARLWVIWRNGTLNADAMADILNFGTFDRAVLGVIAYIPFGSSILALGWMTLRMPPFSPGALVSAWWRSFYFRWFCRGRVQRLIGEVNRPNRAGAPTAFPSRQSH